MSATQDKPDAANLQEDINMQQEYPTNDIPNADTLEAINELEGNGESLFTGSTKDFFKILMESDG